MWKRINLVASVFLCFFPSAVLAQAAYSITDLGTLSPTAINTWAQVAGNYNNQAYIWTFGRSRSLGIIPGGTFSYAAAINDLGTVTGTADGPGQISPFFGGPTIQCSYLIQPFIWTQRQVKGLGTAGPASDEASFFDDGCPFPFYASAINDLGHVVGYTGDLPDAFQWGFLWSSKVPMSLFGSGFPPTLANGINNTGEIVGENGTSFGDATYWKNGVATKLAELPDPFSSSANGVNDLGQIVGWSNTQDLGTHAVMWAKDGTISDLGTLSGDIYSSATKINLFGVVIGSSGNSIVTLTEPGVSEFAEGPLEVVGRPFIWSETAGMRDLNTLISANSGWVLNSVTDINIWGQIVGQGTKNGKQHGFLLTPTNPFKGH